MFYISLNVTIKARNTCVLAVVHYRRTTRDDPFRSSCAQADPICCDLLRTMQMTTAYNYVHVCVVDLPSQCCHYSSGANRAGKQIPLSVLIASQSSVMSVHAVCTAHCSCSRDVRIKESDVIIAYFMTSWRVSAVFGASFVVGAQSRFALKHSCAIIRHLSSH